MSQTWFTSDSHYGHKNMVKGISAWTDKWSCRDFNSIGEMNDSLVAGINAVVRPDDVLYHLGDFNFGGIKNQREFRSRINCKTIHLILGNHDFNHGQFPIDADAHARFSSIRPYAEIVVDGQEIILNHYAQRVWNRQGHESWHLYGHSHGSLPRLYNYSLDIGVDGMGYFNPTPWDMNMLRNVFQNDKVTSDDHHNSTTQSPPISIH